MTQTVLHSQSQRLGPAGRAGLTTFLAQLQGRSVEAGSPTFTSDETQHQFI